MMTGGTPFGNLQDVTDFTTRQIGITSFLLVFPKTFDLLCTQRGQFLRLDWHEPCYVYIHVNLEICVYTNLSNIHVDVRCAACVFGFCYTCDYK